MFNKTKLQCLFEELFFFQLLFLRRFCLLLYLDLFPYEHLLNQYRYQRHLANNGKYRLNTLNSILRSWEYWQLSPLSQRPALKKAQRTSLYFLPSSGCSCLMSLTPRSKLSRNACSSLAFFCSCLAACSFWSAPDRTFPLTCWTTPLMNLEGLFFGLLLDDFTFIFVF